MACAKTSTMCSRLISSETMRNEAAPIWRRRAGSDRASANGAGQRGQVAGRQHPAIFGPHQVGLRAVCFGSHDRQTIGHGLLHCQSTCAGQHEQVGGCKQDQPVLRHAWPQRNAPAGTPGWQALPGGFDPDHLPRSTPAGAALRAEPHRLSAGCRPACAPAAAQRTRPPGHLRQNLASLWQGMGWARGGGIGRHENALGREPGSRIFGCSLAAVGEHGIELLPESGGVRRTAGRKTA
jgi:hypothetical protein